MERQPPDNLVRACLSGAALMAVAVSAYGLIISRTITVDGDMSDWAGIINNPGQFSTDAEGTVDPADLDFPVQATGRDLKLFSYTYDNDNLYFYVERYSSTNNKNDWWFYLDSNADGLMSDGENIFQVTWQGSNASIERTLWTYDAVNAAGDPLVNPGTGSADGWDMPGTNTNPVSLDPNNANITGGSSTGLEMEAYLSWAEMGLGGPTSLQFHVASSNGQNLPNQLDDNMDGPQGGALTFLDLTVTKIADVTTASSGMTVTYSITISNTSATDAATNISLLDNLPGAGLTYIADDSASTSTSYDSAAGRWSISNLAAATSVTLTVEATATVTSAQTLTNTATLESVDQIDTDGANNSASVAVTFLPAPELNFEKTLVTVNDPTAGTLPKNIPGAHIDYTIEVTNTGAGSADEVVFEDTLPEQVSLYVADLDGGSGPFAFTDGDGAGNDLSGLTYTFISLSSSTDDVSFSQNSGADGFTYVPVPDALGFDANVTDVRLTPSGALSPAGAQTPRARFKYRVRLD